MIYLFRKTVYNCQQATLLALKREQGAITLFERVRLSYHLLYCDPCRQFIRQSQQLNEAGKQLHEQMASQPPFQLSPEARERMKKSLENL